MKIMSQRLANERIKNRTDQIVVGHRYFLSNRYDDQGAFVIVRSKSIKLNSCGWPSTVEYEVIESVNDLDLPQSHTCKVGYVGTCNASNLYDRREDASSSAKRKS